MRQRFEVSGLVQGVGFRPFVHRLASGLGLAGWVLNSSAGVVIEVEGAAAALTEFRRRLHSEAPPLAAIETVTEAAMAPRGDQLFAIRESVETPGVATVVPADVATCADCRREIRDPRDRRYRYPFTNCTNCGPRWSLIARLPYDRPATSMAVFEMCAECRREYEDPGNRRFHAQPNACPRCGPQVWLELEATDSEQQAVARGWSALTQCAHLLSRGKIVAIKGLGGFHLAVRADREAAVVRLRERKGREAKPLALMVANLESAAELAALDPAATALLESAEAPIVLLPRRDPRQPDGTAPPRLAAAVAPGQRRIGVMLPYTPLHHLLFDAAAQHGLKALVMTSGNRGAEPIARRNAEARRHLRGIADAWLLHDREILRRTDDSVVRVETDSTTRFLRRARGYAPRPLLLRGAGGVARQRTEPPVLAVGAELKNTLCLLKQERAFLSPHIGDLENPATHAHFRESATALQRLFECEPELIAHDLHPRYLSTAWARAQTGRRRIAIQHHHAHLVAVMAEWGLEGTVVGLILDGTGLGGDGTLWGGEILAGDTARYTRLGHLESVALPGGEAAIRQPWRMALSYLYHACGAALPPLPWLKERPTGAILEILRRGINTPLTSSAGRLFDAVAALTGRWGEARYEAQAAIEFMALTSVPAAAAASSLPWEFETAAPGRGGAWRILTGPLIRGAVQAITAGAGAAEISARFHHTLAELLVAAAQRGARQADTRRVVLGGGVWQNEVLLDLVLHGLRQSGLQPFAPRRFPAGDGAISLGQAVAARAVATAGA